ncbi:putative cell wall protein [Diaporthe ampelina]|uniref:Putative cell wall protein n=1 Tax=Diaporthe ampelina TaxID=1214573 RepID=A0A0G2FV04_9PEZI|nr:putative cell wall protein [Diaporthe ampelina]
MYWVHMLIHLGAVCAASPENHKRDLASIQSSLEAINVGLQRVDTAILGLATGTGVSLIQLGMQAVPLLQNASAQIRQSGPLSLEDSLNLATTTSALRQNTNLTINDLIAQKPLLDQAGSSAIVAAGLLQQRDASSDLAVALASKVAPDTPNVVSALNELASIFDRAIAAFSGADPAAASQPPPAPTLTAAPSGDLAPVTLPAPSAGAMLAPVTGMGTINPDGSCNCAAECPAGSLGGAMVMRYF